MNTTPVGLAGYSTLPLLLLVVIVSPRATVGERLGKDIHNKKYDSQVINKADMTITEEDDRDISEHNTQCFTYPAASSP